MSSCCVVLSGVPWKALPFVVALRLVPLFGSGMAVRSCCRTYLGEPNQLTSLPRWSKIWARVQAEALSARLLKGRYNEKKACSSEVGLKGKPRSLNNRHTKYMLVYRLLALATAFVGLHFVTLVLAGLLLLIKLHAFSSH